MLPAAKLAIQKKITKLFIDQNPVTISLIPRVVSKTATGGRLKTAGDPRDPLVVTLIEPSDSGYRAPLMTSEGSQTTFDYMILAEADAVIEENDVFIYDGREYKITTLMHFNGYERRAMVERHGW